jgi:hypothetical protein
MGALAQGRQLKKLVRGNGSIGQKGSTTIYQGGLVMMDSGGFGVPGAATAGLIALGVAKDNAGLDRWTSGSTDGATHVEYEEGDAYAFDNSGGGDVIAEDDRGKPCYVVDDQTVALTSNSGARPPAGRIKRVEGGKVYVQVSETISKQIMLESGSGLFVSTEQTGNGSAQNIAHGLGVTPSKVMIVPTDTAPATTGAYTSAQGAHTATNVVATVTSGKKYMVIAWV